MTVVISVINLYVYQDQIMITQDNKLVNRMYKLLNYTFIPFAQIGGWMYQSLMVYFIAVIFGSRIRFKKYLTFVGIAYIGFLVSTFLSLIMNMLIYDYSIIGQNILLRYTIGKFGEAFTLILLSFFIYYNEENFSLIKSCLIACLPTLVIILLQILL